MTTHLEGKPLEELRAARNAVQDIKELAGFEVIRESFQLAAESKMRTLTNKLKPFLEPADYEAILGEVRGLESFDAIVEGIIVAGDEAARELEELERA